MNSKIIEINPADSRYNGDTIDEIIRKHEDNEYEWVDINEWYGLVNDQPKKVSIVRKMTGQSHYVFMNGMLIKQ